jgi:hypothetical protein
VEAEGDNMSFRGSVAKCQLPKELSNPGRRDREGDISAPQLRMRGAVARRAIRGQLSERVCRPQLSPIFTAGSHNRRPVKNSRRVACAVGHSRH